MDPAQLQDILARLTKLEEDKANDTAIIAKLKADNVALANRVEELENVRAHSIPLLNALSHVRPAVGTLNHPGLSIVSSVICLFFQVRTVSQSAMLLSAVHGFNLNATSAPRKHPPSHQWLQRSICKLQYGPYSTGTIELDSPGLSCLS